LCWTWIDTAGTLSDANLDHAALTDLIVLNRKLDDVAAPDMARVTKHVLANCQLPLVLAH